MKICIILGTRPEIIKISPIIRYLEKENKDYFIIHTNQHYDKNMDFLFFKDLDLPKQKYNLNVGSASHGKQTGLMLEKIEEILIKENPSLVLVEGDTNTVLAGALAASKLGIKIGHVEAGLRSYDRTMPEEINRILTDHLSDYLFCPTEIQKKNLIKEGIDENKIFITGNTIVDAVFQNQEIAKNKSDIINKLKLENYFLVTAHRPANVDDKENLNKLFELLEAVHNKYNHKIIYPIHPRTLNNLKKFNITNNNINLIEPLGYIDFLVLMKNSKLILTDSGGIQEEACILNIPCLTLRENTERPETINVGANILIGLEKEKALIEADNMLKKKKKKNWENPFGDGTAAQKIINIIK